MTSANVNNGGGLSFNSPIARAFNRTGSTLLRGQLVQFDLTLSSTEATGFVQVDSGLDPEADGFANVVATYATNAGISAIALEDIEDNKPGRFQVEGIVRRALVQPASTAPAGTDFQAGSVVATDVGSVVLEAGSIGIEKALALTLAFTTAAELVTDMPVYFNGCAGFGTP